MISKEDESSTSFSNSSSYPHVQKDNAVFGMPLEIAIALTKIDSEDLIPAIFRRCIEYLDDIGKVLCSAVTARILIYFT